MTNRQVSRKGVGQLRKLCWLVVIVLALSLWGCAKRQTAVTKDVQDLSPVEADALKGMLKKVYEVAFDDEPMIAYYNTTLYMVPEKSGYFGSDATGKDIKLKEPIETLSATYLGRSRLEVEDFEPLASAIACEYEENGVGKKISITDFRISISSGGGGGMMGISSDQATIIPLKVKIVTLDATAKTTNSQTRDTRHETVGEVGDVLDDDVIEVVVEKVVEEDQHNIVSGFSVPILSVDYTVANISSIPLSFDKIETQFKASGVVYVRAVTTQAEEEDCYAVTYLPPFPEGDPPLALDAGRVMHMHTSTGNEPFMVGENELVIEFYTDGDLIYGPFVVTFEVETGLGSRVTDTEPEPFQSRPTSEEDRPKPTKPRTTGSYGVF